MVTKDRRAASGQKRADRAEKPYYKWIVLGTVVFSLLIILLDVTVVNVAIPHILSEFRTDVANVQWVFNAYTLAFAASLITSGRLADMYGHKRMFMLGLTLFGVSSVLSGASPDIGWLIGFRALQGVAGAMMMPATLSLLLQAFPPHQRGMAMGFWGATAGVALAAGPLLGGFLTDNYTWRWVFFINVPVVLIALVLTATFIHQDRAKLVRHKLDFGGFASLTIGLLALTFGLIEGQHYGWGSPVILGCFAAAILLLGTFARLERQADEPLIKLDLFRDRNFTIGNLIALLITFALLGAFFLIPLFVQQILGFSAFKSGLITLPMSVVMLILAPIIGRLSDKFGSRWFIFFGLLFASLGIFLLGHFSTETTASDLIIPFAIFGIGMASVMPVMVNMALAKVPPQHYGTGSGILNTSRQLGGVLGIAIVGAFFTAQVGHHVVPAVRANNDIPTETKQQLAQKFQGGDVQLTRPAGRSEGTDLLGLPPQQRFAILHQRAKTQAAVASSVNPNVAKSVNNTFRFALIFTLLGSLLALFIEQPKRSRQTTPPPVV